MAKKLKIHTNTVTKMETITITKSQRVVVVNRLAGFSPMSPNVRMLGASLNSKAVQKPWFIFVTIMPNNQFIVFSVRNRSVQGNEKTSFNTTIAFIQMQKYHTILMKWKHLHKCAEHKKYVQHFCSLLVINPFNFSTQTRSRARPKIENGSNDRNNEDDDGDDFIALHSCGITTKWRYPKNQRDCIVSNCHQKFQSKSEGIAHYKRYHAIGSILCELCDRPIRSSTGLKDFRRHYANKHKNATVPYNFENESRRLKSENVQVKQVSGIKCKRVALPLN